MSLALVLVHANLVVYSCAYWLSQNAMPLLLKSHGASSLSFGYFQSLFNLVQLVGGLTIGNLQDRFSTKAAMVLTQCGSSLVYGCVAASTSLNGLYASRLPTTLQQTMQVAQGYVAKSTPEGPKRTVALSRLTLSYFVGMLGAGALNMFIFGQMAPIAGVLCAFFLSLSIVVATLILFPSSDAAPQNANEGEIAPSDSSFVTAKKVDAATAGGGTVAYWKLLSTNPGLYLFLGSLYVARGIFESIMQLVLINLFKMEMVGISNITTIAAAIGAFSTVVGTPVALRYFGSERRYTRVAIVMLLAAHLIVIFAVSATRGGDANIGDVTSSLATQMLLAGMFLMAFFSSALYTLTASQVTAGVDSSDHAQAVATTHALRSVVGIFAPIVGTSIFSSAGEGAPGAIATFAISVVLLVCSLGLSSRVRVAVSSPKENPRPKVE